MAIVLVGRALAGAEAPSSTGERWVIAAVAAVTLPGLVVAVVGGVATARRPAAGGRVRYQRLLDWVSPQSASSTPDLRPSVAAEVGVSLVAWSFLLAALNLGLALALPVGEWWRSVPALPVVAGAVVALLVLVTVVLWMGVAVLVIAVRGDTTATLTQVPAATPRPGARMDPVFRLMLLAVAILLLGLGTFGIPAGVLEVAYDVDAPGLAAIGRAAPEGPPEVVAWWTAQRVTSGMTVGGLAAVVVLSPLAFWRMVAGPRRRARDA